ncbi:hypothetical protein WJN01_08685 [Flavobacteriaceae bacterium SZ-1-7]|uniref:hypothetical protein n=1 Tax=Tamlana sedimenti TaxID=3134126 RepID=UPI003129FB8A
MFALIMALSFCGYCQAQFISVDDELHFGAGVLISGATYGVVYTATKDKKKAFWYSLGASVLAGVAKEAVDSQEKNDKFDTGEAIATGIGGLVVSTTLNLFVGKRKAKKRKEMVLVN